ncbi:hypothetical protein F3Y22_tig00110931pilonHSYRG00101 [Hibiscus syriacus]|uniref:Uncharacterized protein n=1 Tax=Hibiscus syriacus TaxID=106335 RepID=A0A6A2ZCQ8_HIBSY|nr:hypothetical protein F3Y22_tig00110931pilonHSYRG00101 [Hibiscus syriacus]
MARFLLLYLVLVNAFLAMASENAQTSGSADLQHHPKIRKLGNHLLAKNIGNAPVSSPFQAPHSADDINEPNKGKNVTVEGDAIHLQKPHHSSEKSIVGAV